MTIKEELLNDLRAVGRFLVYFFVGVLLLGSLLYATRKPEFYVVERDPTATRSCPGS
jgi:hypothetical protein